MLSLWQNSQFSKTRLRQFCPICQDTFNCYSSWYVLIRVLSTFLSMVLITPGAMADLELILWKESLTESFATKICWLLVTQFRPSLFTSLGRITILFYLMSSSLFYVLLLSSNFFVCCLFMINVITYFGWQQWFFKKLRKKCSIGVAKFFSYGGIVLGAKS